MNRGTPASRRRRVPSWACASRRIPSSGEGAGDGSGQQGRIAGPRRRLARRRRVGCGWSASSRGHVVRCRLRAGTAIPRSPTGGRVDSAGRGTEGRRRGRSSSVVRFSRSRWPREAPSGPRGALDMSDRTRPERGRRSMPLAGRRLHRGRSSERFPARRHTPALPNSMRITSLTTLSVRLEPGEQLGDPSHGPTQQDLLHLDPARDPAPPWPGHRPAGAPPPPVTSAAPR